MLVNVIIVDDHPVYVAGLCALIEANEGINVIGKAKDGLEAIELAKKVNPDVIIMDINMPNLNGIDATKEVLAVNKNIKVLALSMHAGKQFVKDMLAAGAKGYLLKDSAPDELITAIRKIARGEMYLSSTITKVALGLDDREKKLKNPDILYTKLHRPRITNDYIIRTQIIEQLEKNSYKPLSLISAPAGYGKSVVASQWLEQTKALHTWFSLDEEHNNLRIFLLYIQAAIEKIFPGSLQNTSKLINTPELPSIEVLSNSLINELDLIQQDFILVLDDFHSINEEKIYQLINNILRFPPEHMHLLLLTRRDPMLNLSSMRAHNRMTEIRMTELCFTKTEIALFFNKLLGVVLNSETIDRLHNKTEGWATGLRMASLTVVDVQEIDQILEGLKGDIHFITEFLAKEVLMKQPLEMQMLFLKTSVLNRFSAELIDAVVFSDDTENISGREFIDWLLKTNLFVISLDDKNKWFRFHHLFQELLQNRFKEQVSEKEIKNQYLVSSTWFESENLLNEAVEYALAAIDLNRIADIVEVHGRAVMHEDKWHLVANWLSLLPQEQINLRPELLLLQALKQAYRFDLVTVMEILDKVDELLGGDIWKHKLSGEVSCLRGFCFMFMNQHHALCFKHIENALDKVEVENIEFRVQTELAYGLVGQITGRFKEVVKSFYKWKEAKNISPIRGFRLHLTLNHMYYISGDIKRASLCCDTHRAIAIKLESQNGIAWSDYLSGVFNLQQGHIDKAINLMEEAATRKYFNFTQAAVDNLCVLAVAYQIKGNSAKANKTLNVLTDFTEYLGLTFPYFAQSCAARVSLMQGNLSAAKKWLEFSKPNFNQVMMFWFELPIITRCRILIKEGSLDKLKIAENELLKYAELNSIQHNKVQLINVKILLSITYWKQNKMQECAAELEEAIVLAKPGGFVFPFLESGEKLIDCLKKLPDAILNTDFVQQILSMIGDNEQKVLSQSENQTDHHIGLKLAMDENLSFREMDVIRLLAEGLRNKEIADKLYISTDTVKKHTGNIYSKLKVNNRRLAVSKAVELGIIENKMKY